MFVPKNIFIKPKVHSEPSETSKVKFFVKKEARSFSAFVKCSILDIWLGSEWASENNGFLHQL